MKKLPLWQYMTQFIDEVEVNIVHDLILARDADTIKTNDLLWNEVTSLNLILDEMKMTSQKDDQKSTGIDIVGGTDGEGMKDKVTFVQWQCQQSLKQIRKLLNFFEGVGETSKLELLKLDESYASAHQQLLEYEKTQNLLGRQDNSILKTHKEEYSESFLFSENNHFEKINAIQSNLNSDKIFHVFDAIQEAFKIETDLLCSEADRLRNEIDFHSKKQMIETENNRVYNVHYDKFCLRNLNNFKTKLEEEFIHIQSSQHNTQKSKNLLPPLQSNLNNLHSDHEKENDYPREVMKTSKKRMRLKVALDTAERLQLETQLLGEEKL